MKKWIIKTLLFIVLLNSQICNAQIKYIIISSYNVSNLCGESQVEGALLRLRQAKEFGKVYYVHFRNHFKTDKARSFVVDKILQEEGKNKIYIVFDDLAYSYFKGKVPKLYASGINGDVYPEDNACTLLERYDFSKLDSFFKHSGKYVSKYYVLYDVNTPTSSFLVRDVINTLKNYELVPIETLKDLEEFKRFVQNKVGYVIINFVLSVKYNNVYLSGTPLNVQIRKMFNNAILVGYNSAMLNLGYDITVSVNFLQMGYFITDMAIKDTCKPVLLPSYIVSSKKLQYKINHVYRSE